MWENVLSEHAHVPWVGGAHGGQPGGPRPPPGPARPQRQPRARLRRLRDGVVRRSAPPRRGPRVLRPPIRTASSSGPTRSAATTAASTSSPAASGPTASCGRPPTSAPARSSTPTCRTINSPRSAAWRCPTRCCKLYDNAARFMSRIGMTFPGRTETAAAARGIGGRATSVNLPRKVAPRAKDHRGRVGIRLAFLVPPFRTRRYLPRVGTRRTRKAKNRRLRVHQRAGGGGLPAPDRGREQRVGCVDRRCRLDLRPRRDGPHRRHRALR